QFQLHALVDARDSFALTVPKQPTVDPEHQHQALQRVISAVLEEVARAGMQCGLVTLTVAALNALAAWCTDVERVVRPFVEFYDAFLARGYESSCAVSSVTEYVLLARPIFECASVLFETALRSM